MGLSWSQLPGAKLVSELTALVWVTKRPKNTAPGRKQLEVSLKGRNLLISLERATSITGGPEERQKGQEKQLSTSVSAYQPASMEDT